MKIADVEACNAYEYLEPCEGCGKIHRVLTQEWGRSEYETDVYVWCECGHFVLFVLPVN